MTRPNLFSFATSELSQDAILCWLAALADHDDADLQRLGKSFIAWLWERAKGTSVEPDQVRLLGVPERQVDHIDVLFEAEIAGAPALFLIEDKTETSHHSGQLKRYLDVVEHGQVVPIYFKTGYHFGSDLAAAKAGYTVIGLAAWLLFLKSQTVRNDILDDYRAHVSEMLRQRDEAIALLATPLGFCGFKHAFVQHDFLALLAARCPEAIGGSVIHRGSNMGGSPWTHYRFVRFEAALPGGVDEVIFHRIDKRKNGEGKTGYYLSTRQYAAVKGKSDAAAAKLSRLLAYRKVFSAAVEQAGMGLTFSSPAGDFRGANESEIGILFFDEAGNSTRAVLDQFPAMHRAFVASLAAQASS